MLAIRRLSGELDTDKLRDALGTLHQLPGAQTDEDGVVVVSPSPQALRSLEKAAAASAPGAAPGERSAVKERRGSGSSISGMSYASEDMGPRLI